MTIRGAGIYGGDVAWAGKSSPPPPRGDWIQTFTKRRFWPLDPDASEVDIRDIAHSLAMTCRYRGHTSEFYSVAQHCVLMADAALVRDLGAGVAVQALLHDAAEAYTVDAPRPIKGELIGFREIEDRVLARIMREFGLPETLDPAVKRLDNAILVDEAKRLMGGEDVVRIWNFNGATSLDLKIVPWDWRMAEAKYLTMFGLLRMHGNSRKPRGGE